LGDAATELGSFDVKLIAQGPQQGHFWLDIEAVVFTVDVQFHVAVSEVKDLQSTM
jgi:hypothetical protein